MRLLDGAMRRRAPCHVPSPSPSRTPPSAPPPRGYRVGGRRGKSARRPAASDSAAAALVAAQPLPALLGPDLVDPVERLERRHALGKLEPGQLATGEDVNVGPDRARIVERPGSDEKGIAGRLIAAPQVRAAGIAEEDVVVLAGAAGQPERRRRDGRLDVFLLDPDVDHESAAGETLTVPAVAGVDDQRTGVQRVADGSARASTRQAHGSLLPEGAG